MDRVLVCTRCTQAQYTVPKAKLVVDPCQIPPCRGRCVAGSFSGMPAIPHRWACRTALLRKRRRLLVDAVVLSMHRRLALPDTHLQQQLPQLDHGC